MFVEKTKCYFLKKLLLWLNMMCIKWMFVEKTVSKFFLKETTVLIECDVYIKCLCLLRKMCTNVLFFKKLRFSLNLQYIFPLILLGDIFSIIWLTVILKIISHCDIKYIMMLQIKTLTSVLRSQYTLSLVWLLTFKRRWKNASICTTNHYIYMWVMLTLVSLWFEWPNFI